MLRWSTGAWQKQRKAETSLGLQSNHRRRNTTTRLVYLSPAVSEGGGTSRSRGVPLPLVLPFATCWGPLTPSLHFWGDWQ